MKAEQLNIILFRICTAKTISSLYDKFQGQQIQKEIFESFYFKAVEQYLHIYLHTKTPCN